MRPKFTVSDAKLAGAFRLDRSLGYNNVISFGHASDFDSGLADKGIILDLLVKLCLALRLKETGNNPFDIVGQTRQYLCMVELIEPIHIEFYGTFILRHYLSPWLANISSTLQVGQTALPTSGGTVQSSPTLL